MGINQVTISGNLTRDPELRSTQGGMSILALGVAVNDRVKNQQTGEWEDRPNFVDCVVFGKRAEALSRLLSKGSKVAVSGRLRYSAWEKDGARRSKLEVIAEEVDLMSARGASEQPMSPEAAAAYMGATVKAPQTPQQPAYAPQRGYQQQAPAYAAPATQAASQPALYDEDIPF
jgi:single-strand DNA-binding protein